MKECDLLNNEKLKFNEKTDLSPFYLERENFIENTFFNKVLENKNNFERIHEDVNEFKMLQNEDKSISSLYYYHQITDELKQSGELKKVEEQMQSRMKNITDYEIDNYSLISGEFEYNINNKDAIFYRRIKANGNSFYISFIYQYLKSLILKGEENIIKEIYYIMEKHLNFLNKNAPPLNSINNNSKEGNLGEMYISKSIKDDLALNQVFALFSLLSNNIFERNYKKAEEILDYAFTYEETFANFFCLYMRFQIQHFIIINKDIFTYENYCKKKNLISEKYYKKGKFLYNEYIDNNLLVKKEPSLFIISLVPYVFNVSMNLYINEKKHFLEKICFDIKEKNNDNTIISILFSSFSYHIIQTKIKISVSGNNIINNINNIDNANTLNLITNFKNFKKENYIININDGKCEICNKSNFVILKNISKIPACLNCLKQTIEEILIERYKKMISERFAFLEFYLRDIPIRNYNDKDNFNIIFLSPFEFYCLFENNLYYYFRKIIIKNICVFCKKKQDVLIKKNCGCLNCLKDASKGINYISLTNFEKNCLYKKEKVLCQCGKENNYVELALQIYDNYDEKEKLKLSKNAYSRNKNYFNKYCMICGTDLKEDNIGKEKIDFKEITFNIAQENIVHRICLICFNKNIKNLSSLNCLICGETHQKEKNEINQPQFDNYPVRLKIMIQNLNYLQIKMVVLKSQKKDQKKIQFVVL